jgi:hypothetical protein
MKKDWLYRLMFGFGGGAAVGALLGFAASSFVMFACSATVGIPGSDTLVISLAFVAVVGCVVAGAILGARLTRKK